MNRQSYAPCQYAILSLNISSEENPTTCLYCKPAPSYLAKAEVDTGSLADVHDLPVRAQHEDKSVQGLQQVRPQLLNIQMQ
jgi:hypothetical protein